MEQFGRPIVFNKEKTFWEKAYALGMDNGWCSGEYDRLDGNPIVEEDRLNKGSVTIIDTRRELIRFFKQGNWCLGQAVIHGPLCFIQQVNGGDEWLTMKLFDDGVVRTFESISFGRMIDGKDTNMYKYLDALSNAEVKIVEREFVKYEGENILRDSEGMAITERKKVSEVVYDWRH